MSEKVTVEMDLEELKRQFCCRVDEILQSRNKNSVDACTQTDEEQHYSNEFCVGLVSQDGKVIFRADRKRPVCFTNQNRESEDIKSCLSRESTPKKSKKKASIVITQPQNCKKSVTSDVSFDMGDNLSRIAPDDDDIHEVFSDEEQCDTKVRDQQCPSCRKVWKGEDVPVVFGYTKPDPYGKVRLKLTCSACIKLQRVMRSKEPKEDIPDDCSYVDMENRHCVLRRGLETVCTIRQNGESWDMANQRLSAKYGSDYLKGKKDTYIRKLSEILKYEAHEGYLLFSHLSSLELLYKLKKTKPDAIKTGLKRTVKN